MTTTKPSVKERRRKSIKADKSRRIMVAFATPELRAIDTIMARENKSGSAVVRRLVGLGLKSAYADISHDVEPLQ